VNDQVTSLPAVAVRARDVDIDGERGYVTEMGGRGPTIVLLPSMLVLGRSYARLTRILCRRFRVTVVEMPGCGHGSVLSEPWSFERYAQWLAKLLEQTPGLDRPTVIGHSNSGPVALIVAATKPEVIGKLVIVDGVGAERSNSLLRVLAGRAFDALLELRLTFWGFHHILFNTLRHWRNFWNQVWLAVRYDVTGYASRVKAPTLVAWGRRDHTVPVRGRDALARVVPGAATYTSATGSHDWLITNAEECAEALERFVNEG
jgi:pimeloyl-ACP methyl ester carboxylesterase